MNPRIIKEARLLFGPWCLIVVGALLPLFSAAVHHLTELSSFFCGVALFGGMAFLAALSLGGEFQQRTISLLLGQPVGRLQIWKEKQVVLVAAVLAALPFFWIGWYDRSELEAKVLVVFGAWLLATMSSATYWTLLTRSMLGGLAIGQSALFFIGVIAINLGLRIFGENPSRGALHVAEGLGAVVCLGYCGLMLWLGCRKLEQFQATGGIAGDDLMMVGPRMMPAVGGELLRCRESGATSNLIRKELRLLKPLWTITLLFIICWACIVITIRVIPPTDTWKEFRQIVPVLAISVYMPLCVMLAGCLSLGEERTSGTHAWHLTLPVSVRRQWFIKLSMALGAGVFCAFVVPSLVIAGGQMLLSSPFGADFKWDWSFLRLSAPWILALFASFPAFWCACAVNGTVRAAVWTLPVMCVLSFAGAGGFWAAQQLDQVTVPLMTMIIARFQLNPYSLAHRISDRGGETLVLWLIFPTLLLAVVQSYRLFRMPPSERILPVVRRLLPLALSAFICALSCAAYVGAIQRLEQSILITETRAAIENLHLEVDQLDAAQPLKLTVDDLAKVSTLSNPTRTWLRNSHITVIPARGGKIRQYIADIYFPDGTTYPLGFVGHDK